MLGLFYIVVEHFCFLYFLYNYYAIEMECKNHCIFGSVRILDEDVYCIYLCFGEL